MADNQTQTFIHPTAIISPKAQLGAGVRVDAYAVIEDNVIIGDNSHVMYHAVLMDGARIGESCSIYPGAVISAPPQDLKYDGQPTLAVIGNNTTIRECVTINRSSHTESVFVGNDCLIMAYTHIAHDCIVGNNVILANGVQLAGHVQIGDWAILGGMSKMHQFCRVGEHAMIASDAMMTKDVPPYALLGRSPVKIEGINKVGLRRRGFLSDEITAIDTFYNMVFFSGWNMSDGISKYKEQQSSITEICQNIITFIESSKRGVYRS